MTVENEGHGWDKMAKKGSSSERKKFEAYDQIVEMIEKGWKG